MIVDIRVRRATVVDQVVLALESVPRDRQPLVQRRALMYAEAIDDGDEIDALFRFGPRLHACLVTLGVLPAGVLLPREDTRRRTGLAA
jgi:hypothetical protein